jgi:hypothetical protein
VLLRIIASVCIFFLVVAVAAVSTAVGLESFTLYSTQFGWVGNASLIGGAVVVLLASLMISTVYFHKYSSARLRYQPLTNIIVFLLAALVISQVEYSGEVASPQVIEIRVLPGAFTVEERTGTDVVAVLADVISPSDSSGILLVLSAASEVEYERVQDALHNLRNAGYENIGLSSDIPDVR